MSPVLQVIDLEVAHGAVMAVRSISLEVGVGELVALIGANGAGKSSVAAALIGKVRILRGSVVLNGEAITAVPIHRRVAKGLCLLPDDSGIYRGGTVDENLVLGAYLLRDRRAETRRRQTIFEYFPILKERLHQKAGTLSGGERQMLAMARALMMDPRVLIMDEPSLGLAPQVLEQVEHIIQRINMCEGTAILLVEQNAAMALRIARRVYVMETGHIVRQGSGEELWKDQVIREAYLGR
jgi:branched-chain amino acid transport system ATP-binding protein